MRNFTRHALGTRAVLSLCLTFLFATPRAVSGQRPGEVTRLIEQLKDENPIVRSNAAQALRDFGPEARQAVRPLIEAMKDEDREVRLYAAEALGNIGPKAKVAVPALIEAMKNDAQDVRQQAAEALRRIQAKEEAAPPSRRLHPPQARRR